MTQQTRFRFSFSFSVLASSASILMAASAKAEPLSVGYGVTILSQAKAACKAYIGAIHEDLRVLNPDGMGSDSILIAVDRGQAELGVSGNPWASALEVASKRKLPLKNLDKIHHEALGFDPFYVITYKGGPAELSPDQIKKLFTGKIKNWKEVGGEDLPTLLVTITSAPGAQQSFSNIALGGEPLDQTGSKLLYRPEELPVFVAKTKGAFAFASSSMDLSDVNRPKHIKIERETTAITLGEPTPRARKLMVEFRKLLAH